jgi:NAD(P)-dependent dehydrogenase (short-subunit alcohol dehydrogenase family)
VTVDQPLALVTGANRGLGMETARQLAAHGFCVLMGSRDRRRGEAAACRLTADALNVVPVQLDVCHADELAAAAAHIEREHGCLDILVNNAGSFVGSFPFETTADEMRAVFETNVFGVVSMIRAFLPLLRRSPAPRIVNVSSTTASLALTGAGVALPGDATRRLAYASSKAALNMVTVQYARAFALDPELAKVRINSATPGYTATDMNSFRGSRTVEAGARIIVELALLPDDGPTGGFFSDSGPVPW